jgi:multimeric flavodoxin WrbA
LYEYGTGETMKNTIALFSSSRRNGNTGCLMDRIANDLSIDVIDLNTHTFSDFDYEHKNKNDDFSPLMEKVLEYDQIIFSSPVYWYSVSPPMKRFLDRISDYLTFPHLLSKGRKLRGKTGYVVCTSITDFVSDSYINAFKETFEYLGMNYGGHIHIDCSDGYHPERHENEIDSFVNKLKNTTP